MVIGEFSFCICGITFHLLYVFYQRFGERKHTVGIFGTIVFKFHHAIVRVIIRAGDADHFKIRTTDGVILFDGKSVTMAQIAGDKLVERTTDKVLVDLIENLCGELSQILLKIVLNKGFETTVGIIQFINRDVTTGVTFDLVQLVVIIHVDAAHGHVGEHHAVSTLQGCHA